MKQFIQENINLIKYFLPIVTGLCVYFIQQFFSLKIKNNLLLKNNKKLTKETESIKSNFNKELEELKKEHQLEISRRKYQYESKKEQYINFFKIMDTFTFILSEKTIAKLTPILDEFNRNFLTANTNNNKKSETKATIVYQKKLQKLMFESTEELRKIKGETNTIKLIASDDVLEKLEFLEHLYEKSLEDSNKIISSLSRKILAGESDSLKQDENSINLTGEIILKTKNELIFLMRKELSEI